MWYAACPAKTMIHQAMGGAQGQAEDIKVGIPGYQDAMLA